MSALCLPVWKNLGNSECAWQNCSGATLRGVSVSHLVITQLHSEFVSGIPRWAYTKWVVVELYRWKTRWWINLGQKFFCIPVIFRFLWISHIWFVCCGNTHLRICVRHACYYLIPLLMSWCQILALWFSVCKIKKISLSLNLDT